MFSGICMGADREYKKPEITIDENQLYASVQKLAGIGPSRNYLNIDSLNKAADFIKRISKYGYSQLNKNTASAAPNTKHYRNVSDRRLHQVHCRRPLDVYGSSPGLMTMRRDSRPLNLAELFKKHAPKINIRIDFVAYTLEEPPFFRTKNMGSFIHAKSLHDAKVNVLGMLSLEMLGFYSDAAQSQAYPLPFMNLFYPSKGNFIGVVGNFASSGLVRHFKTTMRLSSVDVESLSAPSFLIGVDFSDHMNYWKFGYHAIMITDTSFYRNPNYHSRSDTIDTLNSPDEGSCKGALLGLDQP
jgi:hypothetical protein